MKEYERYVFWLEYFNSELKRSEGRRVPLSSATKAPTVLELEEACRKLNLQPLAQGARYPGSPAKDSGYVSVRKSKPKQALLMRVAKELSSVRGRGVKAQQPGQKRHEKTAKP
ncbi:MAG: signal recognition particle subunit SRP19/SEC65 family protein [Thaumarchaeota archaeon]|nr:signal recognition particle subunit SRP19/SEC65 family protein [Nitrososphaerota archaeon]